MSTNPSPASAPEGKPVTEGPKPVVTGKRGAMAQFSVYLGLLVPMLALIVAVPFAWGWGLSWVDVGLFLVFYVISGLGVTVAYHRHFTHGAFKARPWLRVALGIAGSTALQGPVIMWVADHRRHHAFADRDGDPHSPWLFGTTPWAIAKGFWHAHLGWNFSRDLSNVDRFAPDLVEDPLVNRINRLFWLWTLLSLTVPALLGGLITWSLWGAVTAFFWAGLVRVCVLHHVTWSVNSICHMLGERPFTTRDKSANFWPLAIVSFGESWHNLHHADPTCARHGVQRGQIDISARVIWMFERFGWAYDVRWPTRRRLNRFANTKRRIMTNHRITVRRPEWAELPAVAEAYTAANLHDPVLSWVIDDEEARRRLTIGTWPETTVAYLEGILHSGELVMAEDGSGAVAGVSLWERIDHSRGTGTSGLQDPEGARFIERAYGEYADRMKLLIELTGQRLPKAGAYWYLLNIVVGPDRRGQGIGGAMLREQLRRLDAESAPVYLEASSPRNRRLYERVGFTDLGDPIELPDGPRLQPMWRPATVEVDRSHSTG